MLNLFQKILIGIPLIYATYINFTCPCSVHLSCHLTEFFGSILFVSLYAIFLNA